MPSRIVFIFCVLILTACQLSSGIVSQPTLTIDLPAVRTVAAATAIAQLTAEMALHTAAAATVQVQLTEIAATPSVTPTLIVKSRPTDKPYPTPLPTIDQIKLPDLLKTTIVIQPETFNGHTLQKITGWDFGFTEFQWMDSRHLLLGAAIDFLQPEHGVSRQSHPAVIDLDTQKVWLPGLTQDELYGRSYSFSHLPVWSSKLGALITSEKTASGDAATLYSANGEFLAIHPGTLLGVSPSGTKLLFSDGTWLDLTNGKQVHFAWKLAGRFEESRTYHRPIWSANEKRVFVCGVAYGDASTGDSYEEVIDSELLCSGTWILNDRYFIGYPGLELSYGPPLFDSGTHTYIPVHSLAKIPDMPGDGNRCNYWDISPNGKYVWLVCFDGGHLVDLTTFESWSYPDYSLTSWSPLDWSDDGKFATIDQGDSKKLLSLESKKLLSKPENCWLLWPPTGNSVLCFSKTEAAMSLLNARTFAVQKQLKPSPVWCDLFEYLDQNRFLCLSSDEQTLWLLNLETFSIEKKIALPVPFGNSLLILSPDRKQVALLAKDNSLWQVDYPSLENLAQLTPAKPQFKYLSSSAGYYYGGMNAYLLTMGDITWAPDSSSLAFRAGTDIYIVETQVKP